MRGFDNWSINTPTPTGLPAPVSCPNKPRAALMLDASATETRHGHCENFSDCVLLGANNANASGMRVNGITEAKGATYAVEISANNPGMSDFMIEDIQTYTTAVSAVRDDLNNITLNNRYVSLYSWSTNTSGTITNLVTTDTTIPNRFPSGISIGGLANTDLAGQCMLGSAACSSGGATKYTFSGSYSNAPICTCTDVSGVHACSLAVTNTTITFTGNGSDLIDYTCVSRN